MPSATATTRHVQPGVTVVKHLPAVVNLLNGPTRSELAAGTDISLELLDWDGWAPAGSTAPSRSVGTKKVGGVPSVETLSDSSLTLNSSRSGQDTRALFVNGLAGFVVFMDSGDVPTQLMDVFKTEVINTTPVRSADGSAVLAHKTMFAIRDWQLNVAIPAAN